MEQLWVNIVKPAFIAALAWFCAVISPVENMLWLFMAAFSLNIIVGIAKAVNADKEDFSIKKFFSAFSQLILWMVCVVFIHWLGYVQDDGLMRINGTKWVTYIVIYSYFLNIFKNAKSIWPESKGIEIIYEILSTEVLFRIKGFWNYGKKKEDQE